MEGYIVRDKATMGVGVGREEWCMGIDSELDGFVSIILSGGICLDNPALSSCPIHSD